MRAFEAPWSSSTASAPVLLSLASSRGWEEVPGEGPWATSWAAEPGSSEQPPEGEVSVVPAGVSKDYRGLTRMNVDFMYFKMRANGHLRMEEIRFLGGVLVTMEFGEPQQIGFRIQQIGSL